MGEARSADLLVVALMCACEPAFTCSRCAGTPADPHYLEDEVEIPEPFTAEDA